jgi:hypothetical protein
LRNRFQHVAPFEFDGSDLLTDEVGRAVDDLLEASAALLRIAAFELPPGAEVRLRDDFAVPSAAEKLIDALRGKGRDETQS